MRRPEGYQLGLIVTALLVVAFSGVFIYRELRPDYKRYQQGYIDLEEIRAERTGVPAPHFKKGVKQILVQDSDVGPETVDRCTSCHVAMKLPHFSPTRPARDINGNLRFTADGEVVLEPNPDYIFIGVEGKLADLEPVLMAHPLLEGETRPFEFHPMEQWGCTSCHGGNGRSLVAERAHGPVFEGEYHANERSPVSPYVEVDEVNDPEFSRVFTAEPGHDLRFQTTPLMPGALMQSRCLQCHKFAQDQFDEIVISADVIRSRKERELERLKESLAHDVAAKEARATLYQKLSANGLESTRKEIKAQLSNPALTPEELDAFDSQLTFLESTDDVELLKKRLTIEPKTSSEAKEAHIAELEGALLRLKNAEAPIRTLAGDKSYIATMADKAGQMLGEAKRGEELFVHQACYACHKIEGLSRGQVGPDLTEIGLSYPWYVKLSIVWPQGKIDSSAMPNMKLDHHEVEDLMAFLMAQTHRERALSEVDRDVRAALWEKERNMPWEQPVAPSDIHNVAIGQTIYATEGCAACHKMVGFESDFGFVGAADAEERLEASSWFRTLFPDPISGLEIAERIEEHGEQIDQRIGKTADGSILERLRLEYPGVIESYYTPFAVAGRASSDPTYQRRLEKVWMIYIEEYGLGRDIGPRLSWSGVMRDPEWLLGHFHNPAAYTAKSIMPVMPFDESRFYTLNSMLQQMGEKNVEQLKEIWTVEGFHPELAYELLCSTCHGTERQGAGVVSEYIYPVPKNLRNATFLRNLTREQAIQSITHGVPGTPMPPWGNGVLTDGEIAQLVEWLYSELPGQTVVPDEIDKWEFSPDDVMKRLQEEGSELRSDPTAGPGTYLQSSLFLPLLTTPRSSNEIFDEVVDPKTGEKSYYIKRRFYTESNLAAGEQLFVRNCSHCHGPSGEGNGIRAERMVDAKPRMLTNLPWAESRDDMRLIRSIRYGVPGTAMTPWGDKTSMLQQLQLVIYIRTLTEEKAGRAGLQRALYSAYDQSVMEVERCRVGSFDAVAEAEKEHAKFTAERERWYQSVQMGEGGADEATRAYQQELESLKRLETAKRRDDTLQALIGEIRNERALIAFAGEQLIATEVSDEMLLAFDQLVAEKALRYLPDGDCFRIEPPLGGDSEERLLALLDGWIAQRKQAAERLRGKLWDARVVEEEKALLEELNRLTNARTTVINQLRLAERSQQRQMEIYGHLQ